MTQHSVVRARIDECTKRQAAAALKKVGLSKSFPVRVYSVVKSYPLPNPRLIRDRLSLTADGTLQ